MKRPPQIPISDSDWQRTPTAVQVLVVSSSERVGQLEQVVEQQAARVASLEEELARRKGRSRRGARAASSQSGASSSPRTEASRRRSSGRSPGGQPGHEGHGRSWVPVEQVDELIPVKPSTCHGCGHPLTGDDPHPQRHQEVVIPPLRAEVIEYQVHTLRCAPLRPPDRSRLARGRIAAHLRSQRASLGEPAGRGLPAEQAQHPGAVVRRLRPRGVAGYGQPAGTGSGRGPGGSGRGGARPSFADRASSTSTRPAGGNAAPRPGCGRR